MSHSPHVTQLGLSVDRSAASCSLSIAEPHLNSGGIVHGGVLFSMVDVAMALAILRELPPEQSVSTIDARISYFKAVRTGELVCQGTLTSRGKSVAHVEATITGDGELVARAMGTFAIHARR